MRFLTVSVATILCLAQLTLVSVCSAQDDTNVTYNGITINLPSSFEKAFEQEQAKHSIIVWLETESESEVAPVFSLSCAPSAKIDRETKASDAFAGFLHSVSLQRADWTQSTISIEHKNGIAFWKTTWSGKDKRTGVLLKGIVIGALSNDRLTYISAQATEEDSAAFISKCNAAILSVKPEGVE